MESHHHTKQWFSFVRRYGIGLLAAGGSIAVRLALMPLLGTKPPYITFYLGIVVAAAFGGIGPGLLVTCIGVLFGFFVLPGGPVVIEQEAARLGLFVLSGIGICLIAEGMHRQRRKVQEQAQELQRAHDRLQKAISIETVGVLFFNLDGHILGANSAFEKMTGYTIEELRQKEHWESLTAPEFWPVTMETAERLVRYGKTAPYEKQMIRKDGSRWWGLFNPMRLDDSGSSSDCIEFIIDISERKKNEEELKKAMDQVTRSNTELEQFAYVASHDLQEPLRMVSGYMQLLQKKYQGKLDEKADMYIHYAVDGATRMQSLIEGLLKYSRIAHAEIAPVDMNVTFQDAIANLATAIEESHGEVVRGNLPTVMGDGILMLQLMQNLISNALKYRKPDTPPRVVVSAERNEQEWVVSVRDNGIGINQADQEKVFQIFRRLHTQAEVPGTGIGLASCKKIVEQHHGHIWLESAPGEGSTFFFTMPVNA